MDIKLMRRVGREISVLMGITLSFFLSLTGVLLSGHFTLLGWLISFAISTVISLLIGFIVPMKPLLDKVTGNMRRGAFSTRCLESLISDLIYTPIITLAMVAFAYKNIASHAPADQVPPFLPMFLISLAEEMVIGFILIFIFMPLYMRLVMKRHGIQAPGK